VIILFSFAKNNTNSFSNLCGSWILTESEVLHTNCLESHDHVKQLFSQKMIEIKNYCVLKYYSSRKNKKVKITKEGKRLASVFYARCKHEDCNHYVFRFSVDTDNTRYTLQLLSTKIGSNHKPEVFHAPSLTGLRRQSIKEELTHKSAAMVRRDAILKADPKMLAAGNLSNIYSKNALQMARNEKLAENDLHWDDVADLILRCRKERDQCSPDMYTKPVTLVVYFFQLSILPLFKVLSISPH